MPYGQSSFVCKLLPLHPGYVRIVCAVAVVAAVMARSNEDNIVTVQECEICEMPLGPMSEGGLGEQSSQS